MLHLQYPIGKFDFEKEVTDTDIAALISNIESLPQRLSQVVRQLTAGQLEIPYRPGGWKVKQVVHHLADSHMNAYIRLNLALTENSPNIKPYAENKWAELSYKENMPAETSLQMLALLHRNMVTLFRSLESKQFDLTYIHPEYNRIYSLRKALALYAWHGEHHLAHITGLIQRNFDGQN